jgi:hypothetical protein
VTHAAPKPVQGEQQVHSEPGRRIDYVHTAYDWKRRRLKALGYRVVIARGEAMAIGLEDLAARLHA